MEILKSQRLNNLRYDIRGPVYEKSLELESQGYKIINLNIGNPAPFGFDAPDEIVHDIILNIRNAQGYADSRGLFAARKAVMHYTQTLNLPGITINDIFIGNGVSELILLSMQALINEGDEVLVPAPDYPLWTTSVALSGGKPVHYVCDEAAGWNPDLADLERKITKKTRALVVINPNNPTGAVYDKAVLEGIAQIAERHSLIVFTDEIYDKILYDGAQHHPMARFVHDTLCITMGGLSKNYRAAGFRGGWLILSGARAKAKSYIEGLTLMASLRLCANVPTQYAIQTALGGYQSIQDLVHPSGRLYKQIMLAHERLTAMPGITCTKPKGALYVFPKIDLSQFRFKDDNEFVYDLLAEQKVLVVAGQGFNYPQPDHFRVVCLPTVDELNVALDRIEAFLVSRHIGS
ncbi:aminotransferase class I/II-fold pyridoxal phosphate-dependent enzyme [Rudanella paleaurantiibacter]|uniref:alanine transaminase n=1 Tax=Rudanella paleaurantiibacter TaxID=2614655 RepID=A0A7J5TYH3_9BACT|nr:MULTISPECIES: pyridoxal phosphate-dependent aminotransferase [Rudanella]KAB7730182.1 aminotransferase class I/II-fold pyridoxal phosphate-dependent enzyme [Rudanella paleaurantiibacter]